MHQPVRCMLCNSLSEVRQQGSSFSVKCTVCHNAGNTLMGKTQAIMTWNELNTHRPRQQRPEHPRHAHA